jgi:hypothetical protein
MPKNKSISLNTQDFFEIVKQVLIPMFYKEDQLGRSLRENNKRFKVELSNAILQLARLADEKRLKNKDIRTTIKEVSRKSGVSIGQAQKTINVYLKYYCILTKKPIEIIKELDCPLDSMIMTKFKSKALNLKKASLKGMTDFDTYIAWQNHLEQVGNGLRLKADIETYDKERLKQFFS